MIDTSGRIEKSLDEMKLLLTKVTSTDSMEQNSRIAAVKNNTAT